MDRKWSQLQTEAHVRKCLMSFNSKLAPATNILSSNLLLEPSKVTLRLKSKALSKNIGNDQRRSAETKGSLCSLSKM